MTNPLYDAYAVLHKVYGGGAYLKQALADTPVEPAERARTVKLCYGVLENDRYLDFCIRSFAPKNPKLPVRILLKIALYMLLFLDKPRYMVADNAVSLVKKMGKGGAAGFVNAFLRAFDADKVQLPAGEEGLAIRCSWPDFAVRRVAEEYGGEAEEILRPRPARTFVRFRDERAERAYRAEERGERTPFPLVWSFASFRRDEGYDRGEYTFQSVGSVAICAAVDPCGQLLDACAAPGGKSVLLSAKCASVTACELHPHRAALIESYCARMGAGNVRVLCRDSSVFDPAFAGAFDAVLVDAPCSGSGVAGENPDVKLFRKAEDIPALAAVQRALLSNCARYVRPGGQLYYSTCSIFGEENDGSVRHFLESHADFTALPLDSPLPARRTRFGLQFLPHISMGAGFYVAKLRKEKG